MYTTSINWRNMVAIAICSAVLILSAACDKTDEETVKDADITVHQTKPIAMSLFRVIAPVTFGTGVDSPMELKIISRNYHFFKFETWNAASQTLKRYQSGYYVLNLYSAML